MTKRIITKTEKTIYRYDLDGMEMGALRDLFDGYAKAYGENAMLDICCWGDGDMDISIESKREETDAEYAARIERESAHAKAQEAQERATLAKLQAKYGKP